MTDCTLIEKLLKVKFLLGVSYRTMARKIGTSPQVIYNIRKVRPSCLSDAKKMELEALLDNYLKITETKGEK